MSFEEVFECRRVAGARLAGVEFAPKDQKPQEARDREFALRHVRLDISIDFAGRRVRGSASHRLAAINPDLRHVKLDAVDMSIKGARAGGKALDFDYDGRTLDIDLGRRLKENEEVTLEVRYGARPRKGMFFISPDKDHPRRADHIWTQGEMEDNRHWFPSYDYPNQRCTSEVLVEVPEKWVAVANGRVVAEGAPKDGRKTWRFLQDKEHVNYLITVVAGDFAVVKDSVDGIPLEYWAPRSAGEKEMRFSFQSTPDVLRFMHKATGLKYPFAKLTQVVVQDFTFGGMENTTLITLYEGTLHSERAVPDYRVEGLIAHEAAHQWFGDLMTCRSWGHLWLNEGFASYFSPLYFEHKWGKEEFQWQMIGVEAQHLSEAGSAYMRPIVTNRYKDAEDMFDAHSYQKGACTLHMLRSVLGDGLFFKAIRHYVATRQNTIVETNDLKEAIEQATGRNLDWFFEQCVYKPGHLDLEISWEWDGGAGAARVKVKQRQRKDEKSEIPIFKMPAEIELLYGDKKAKGGVRAARHVVELSKAEDEFHIPSKEKPKTIVFDPDHWLLAKREFKKPKPEMMFQAEKAPTVHGRVLGCEGLANFVGDDAVIECLERVLVKDAFHGVRRSAARALGEIQGEKARAVLLKGAQDKDSRVRRIVYESLGKFKEERVVRFLASALRREKADYAAASAAAGLGATRLASAFRPLVSALGHRSHFDAVERSALAALAQLRDERAFDVLKRSTARTKPSMVRAAAIDALATLADQLDKRKRETREFVEPLLKDPEFRIRGATVGALVELAEPEAIPALRRLDGDLFGRVRRHAERGIQQIGAKHSEKAQRRDFGEQVEGMRKENLELKRRVERLEARFEAKGKKKG